MRYIKSLGVLALCAGCQPQESFVVVTLNNLAAAAQSVSYAVQLPGTSSARDHLPVPSGNHFALALPEGALGQQLTLSVDVFEGVCPLQHGELPGLALVGSSPIAANIDLATPSSKTCTVEVRVSGPGVVVSDPAGISCATGTCSARFPDRTTVRLLAQATSGGSFSGWSGGCSGAGDCVLAVPATTRQTLAQFQPATAVGLCSKTATAVSPAPTTQSLGAVWGLSDQDLWAVGQNATVLHHKNGSWSQQTLSGSTSELTSIWGSAANNVWTTGARTAAWVSTDSATFTDNSGSLLNKLTGVWGSDPDNFFAVGSAALALKWSATMEQWEDISPPGVTIGWNALWGRDPSQLWAVGGMSNLYKWSGSSWSQVPLATSTTVSLNGITGTALGPLWIVGTQTTILRSDAAGATWVPARGDLAMNNLILNKVWTDGVVVWVVGDGGVVLCSENSGQTWRQLPLSGALSSRNYKGVWGTATSVWVVGDSGTIVRFQ